MPLTLHSPKFSLSTCRRFSATGLHQSQNRRLLRPPRSPIFLVSQLLDSICRLTSRYRLYLPAVYLVVPQ